MWKKLPANMTYEVFSEFLKKPSLERVTVFAIAGGILLVHDRGISSVYDKEFFDKLVSLKQTVYYYSEGIKLPEFEIKTFLGKIFVPATAELVRGDFYMLKNSVVEHVKVVYDEFEDEVNSFFYGNQTAARLAEKLNEEGMLIYREGY